MRYEIKSITIWPLIKVSFFLSMIVGFIFGLLYAIILSFVVTIASSVPMLDTGELALEDLSVGLLLVVLPIFGAIGGAVFHTLLVVVLAIIYNLVARVVGGYEIRLERVEESPPPVRPVSAYTAATPPPPPPPPSDNPPASSREISETPPYDRPERFDDTGGGGFEKERE
ncbi:MAG: DUF3566 domain-containing protein [candidate division Zixibacteria bacterium]|nr:DUF3566 domain-containing protein [candidate division Zixibacteria bacterium]